MCSSDLIEQYVTVTALPGLYYPEQDVTKPFGRMYSYWRSFTSVQAALSGIQTTSGADLVALKDALVAVTGDPWVVSGESRYSLAGATFVYNGPTSGNTDLNTSYNHGMIVNLSASCLGLSGSLNIHYDTP